MRLTSLDIKGFKSFPEKTTIHFNDNITGIVGPNGCGKSNIVDSIRWVLGEQKTSHLRLEKMENLIFNGTKKRKASNLAEVTLTFENTKNIISSEFKNVTITRKLYRDGESEYRLNDVPCRLKDISNLFLDTGVGSDSYAIIELGMVDEILNDRDNSRRRLFEQAAGIEKYKKRKKETFQKLKGTEADLERVQDLLFEIESNMKSLESQARRTKRFYQLKDKYKEFSLELAKHQISSHKDVYERLSHSLVSEEDRKLDTDKALKLIEAKLEEEKAKNIDKEKVLSETQKKLNSLLSGVSNQENDRNLLIEKTKHLREKKEVAERQIAIASDETHRLNNEIEINAEKTEIENQKLKALQDALSELESILNEKRTIHKNVQGSLSTEKESFSIVEKQLFDLEKEFTVNKVTHENLERETKQYNDDVQLKQEQVKQLNEAVKVAEKEKETFEKDLSKLVGDDDKLKKKIDSNFNTLENVKADLVKENRLLDAKENEYKLTKSLVDNLEGFPESIKFLKKNSKWAKDAPLLSDIIFCDEAYRVAIENYLEPYLNYYIVQNIKEATIAVNLLNDSGKGRASFFILDEFKHYKPSKPLLIENGIPASEIVEMDAPYHQLGAFLLDNVYILEDQADSDIGKSILAERKDEIAPILLSKSGKYIRTDFALAGGAIGLFEGKRIGRAKNLEKLAKQISQIKNRAEKLNDKRADLESGLSKLKGQLNMEEIEEQKRSLNKADQKLTTIQVNLQNILAQIESSNQKQNALSERMEALQNSNLEIETKLVALRDQRTGLQNAIISVDKRFADVNLELEEAGKSYNEQNIQYHQQLNIVNSLKKELEFAKQRSDQLKEQEIQNLETIEASGVAIEEQTLQLKGLESGLLSGYADKENFEKEIVRAEENYYQSRGIITDLENDLRELNRKKDQADVLLNETKDQLNNLKLELSSVKERLSIEFNIDINDLLEIPADEQYDKEELEGKVFKIKAKIENYGSINPMAIEAFEEMKTRYDFIIEQKQDLTDAKKSLLETIEEVESKAKEKFLDAFQKGRENFIEVFRTLFSEEDQCNLILQDPDNPLESKIDIIAKPKGKRPTVIDQLSGGEKTLTATALLFSLYLLKPAPFCVFDEVDAPLDDTNIHKFNKIIRKFSKDSQFIIITHNKQTMTAVDVIYGVTMADAGVSKVVPVNFQELSLN